MTELTKETIEKYLETILILSQEKPVVRSIDLATALGRSKARVSTSVKNLRERNYITITSEGFIYFTDAGREIASVVHERHKVLCGWLTGLGVNEKTAAEDAARIKHFVSQESIEAIKNSLI